MERPTVHDLARRAKVSLATVDRVLNGRPGVREQTVARVQKAIEELNYSRDANAATLARKQPHRFVFLLPRARTQFLNALIGAIEETALSHAASRSNIEIVQAAMQTPEDASHALRAIDPEAIDGLAIMAPETPTVRDAVINLRQSGVQVVPIITDLPGAQCGHFVGVNNIAAGRTAARLLGGFVRDRQGTVAVIGGHTMSRDFLDRRLGFDAVMREAFPDISVLPSGEGADSAERVERIARKVLERHQNLAGIYLTAAGTAGLYAALAGHPEQRPTVIAHELTATTRKALNEGMFDAVISQDVGHIARSAVRVLRAMKDKLPLSPGQERIRIDIFTRDNLPVP